VGNFYRVTGGSLHAIMAGQYPSIHVLIVSAFYGLAKLDEGLKEYELQMGDMLHSGIKVYQFWQRNNLWQILQNYINQNNITYVWSLLPDSPPSFQYHRVFNGLWRVLRNTQGLIPWPKGNPPKFELIPLGNNRFRLEKIE
jgi:hypothetical protein